MITHELVQGSAEWHTHRATHYNASDAPAMLGCSPYETRTQLIHRLSTGIAPEVDAATQRRFDEGHRIEALARPLAEEIIGEELYPVTGSEGKYSASFDGLTMGENISGEHKSLNDGIRASLPHVGRDSHTRNDGAMLGKLYRVQMEQQLMVSGAERALFSATRWEGDTLVEERHCWYEPDLDLRAEIIAGWKQLAIDKAAYVPAEVVQAAVAAPTMNLPAVSVQMNGSIAVISNLDVFGAKLQEFVAGLDKSPSTDQAFADTEAAIKTLQKAQDALEAAEAGALAQTASIEEMRRTVGLYVETARTTRLMLEKMVKARKEQIRVEIVHRACFDFSEHVASLNKRIGRPYMPDVPADFVGAVKGKRTIDSLHDAVDTELARAKIAASAIADKIQINLAYLRENAADYTFLFSDAAQIVLKAPDDLTMLVRSRIAEHQAAEEKKETETRERIRSEEQAKAEKAAREQIEREQREADAKRKLEEHLATSQQREDARQAEIAGAVLAVRANAAPQGGQDEFDNWRQGGTPASIANVVPMRQPQPAAPTTPPSLTLGMIGTRLGFNLSADFLKNLGFEATKVKASCLYHEADFQLICMRLVAHVQRVRTKQAA